MATSNARPAGNLRRDLGAARSIVLACALVLGAGSALRAHEIGTTRVAVVFHADGAYTIDVTTDATALLEKLESLAAAREVPLSKSGDLQARLAALDAIFRQRVALRFDGAAAAPSIAYAVNASSEASGAPSATIRLTGHVPPGGRTFAWNYGWTFASYALTVRSRASDNPATQWLEGGADSTPVALLEPVAPASRGAIAWRYLALGFTHIIPLGFDHVLFVLGIYLLRGRTRAVLWQVSAFTVAHSITLALGMYGLVRVPPAIVEPLISLSIAYVAIENIFLTELKSRRIALVFAFGLLHGLGFAGALRELGLPRTEFVTALVAFNVGVEAGQLAVIALAFGLVGWHCATRPWYRTRVVIPASLVMACTALYWALGAGR
jgi:hypothetical protein